MASLVQDNFNAGLCFRDKILWLQFCRCNTLYETCPVTKSYKEFMRLVAGTESCRMDKDLHQKYLVHTRSNLLLRRVTATCWLDCFELSEQRTNLRNNYSFQRLFLPFSPMHKYLEDLSFPLVFEFHKLNIVSVFLFWWFRATRNIFQRWCSQDKNDLYIFL